MAQNTQCAATCARRLDVLASLLRGSTARPARSSSDDATAREVRAPVCGITPPELLVGPLSAESAGSSGFTAMSGLAHVPLRWAAVASSPAESRVSLSIVAVISGGGPRGGVAFAMIAPVLAAAVVVASAVAVDGMVATAAAALLAAATDVAVASALAAAHARNWASASSMSRRREPARDIGDASALCRRARRGLALSPSAMVRRRARTRAGVAAAAPRVALACELVLCRAAPLAAL